MTSKQEKNRFKNLPITFAILPYFWPPSYLKVFSLGLDSRMLLDLFFLDFRVVGGKVNSEDILSKILLQPLEKILSM